MSRQYDEYITQHKNNVAKGFTWLKENLPGYIENSEIGHSEWQCIFAHDTSKNSPEEYDSYDRYFYGNKESESVKRDFDFAWLHHIHNNPHHWQHWVLINDDDGTRALDMPYEYIIEMICDWWAFSWAKGNLYAIFEWYDDHKSKMILSDTTKNSVENILSAIRQKLDESKED